MAWYDVTYKCGHEGREQIYGTNVHGERDRRVEWISEHKLCPECYKAEKRREEKEMGLVCAIKVDTIKMVKGEGRGLVAVFEGDTYPRKDEIKALGAKWEEAPQSVMHDILGKNTKMAWCLHFDAGGAEDVAEKIRDVGARIVDVPSGFDLAALSAKGGE